jgi:hypothetical protein
MGRRDLPEKKKKDLSFAAWVRVREKRPDKGVCAWSWMAIKKQKRKKETQEVEGRWRLEEAVGSTKRKSQKEKERAKPSPSVEEKAITERKQLITDQGTRVV